MNLKNYNYPTIDKRFPKALGSFDEQLRYSLRFNHWLEEANDNFLHVYNTGWNSGYGKGVEDGVIAGIKNYTFSGRGQMFIDKQTGAVYPFDNMDELTNPTEHGVYPPTVDGIKRFLYDRKTEELPIEKQKYKESLKNVEEKRGEISLEKSLKILEEEKIKDNNDIATKSKKLEKVEERIKKENKYDKMKVEDFISNEELDEFAKEIQDKAKELEFKNKRLKDPKTIYKHNNEIIEKLNKELEDFKTKHNPEMLSLKDKRDKLKEDIINARKAKKTSLEKALTNQRNGVIDEMKKLKEKGLEIEGKIFTHDEFKKQIERSLDLYVARDRKRGYKYTKEQVKNYADPNYKDEVAISRDFRFYKPGTTAMFQDDNIGIINVAKTQKTMNPNLKTGLKDIKVMAGEVNDKLETKNMQDFRKNKGNEERTYDAIPIPKLMPGNTMNSQNIQQLWKPLFNLK